MFTTDLCLVGLDRWPDFWYFNTPLVWQEPGLTITVPAGFITDLASIPHALDWLPFLDRTGLSRRPAALHDALYALGRERGKDFADGVLRRALLAEGLNGFQAWCYYEAVHVFGRKAYASDSYHVDIGAFITVQQWTAYAALGATIFSPTSRILGQSNPP